MNSNSYVIEQKDMQSVISLTQEMQKRNVHLNSISVEFLIEALAQDSQQSATTLVQFLQSMISQNIRIDPRTYIALLR